MKFFRSPPAALAADPSPARIDRRSVVVGAGVAGAAAVAAAALHRRAADLAVAAAEKPAPAAEGYRETPHVLRYYETTRS